MADLRAQQVTPTRIDMTRGGKTVGYILGTEAEGYTVGRPYRGGVNFPKEVIYPDIIEAMTAATEMCGTAKELRTWLAAHQPQSAEVIDLAAWRARGRAN